MTTAHRPTFDPARGKEAARGEAYHQRLLPAHKTLKFRQATQGAPDEQARRNLQKELLRAEAKHYAKKEGRALPEDDDDDEEYGQSDEAARRKPLQAIEEGGLISEDGGVKRKLSEINAPGADGETGRAQGEDEEDYEAKKRRVLEETRAIDAESESSDSSEESEDDDDDDEDDSDDDDDDSDNGGGLERELAKIKDERKAAAAQQAKEQAKRDEEQREKDIALGNPLLNAEQGRGDYGVKRRWDDDVVFKNQARGTEERGKEKRFVNDLLRSDFHRRFMDKYIR